MNKEKMVLYAAAIEKLSVFNGVMQWVPDEIVYTHATNQAAARITIMSQHNMKGRKILAIAPVIGYNVLDNHGDKLSV